MKGYIKSKRNIVSLTLTIVLAGVFSFFPAFSIFKIVSDIQNNNSFSAINLFFILLFTPLVLYILYAVIIHFPIFTIDKIGVTVSTIFKTKKYLWTEIESISLTGTKWEKAYQIEVVTFSMKDNSQLYLSVDNYRNQADLRIVLERANTILIEDVRKMNMLDFAIVKSYPAIKLPYNQNEIEFNDNHFLKGNSLFLSFFCAFIFLCVLLYPQVFLTDYVAISVISIVTLVFTWIFSWQMHYIILTPNLLIVKNSLWFWRKDVYLLSDIREVSIGTLNRLLSIRVVTKEFGGKFYPTEGLKNETWKKLIRHLRSENVKVRNDAINFKK